MKRLNSAMAGLFLAPITLCAFADPPNLEARLRAQYPWTTVDSRTGQVIQTGCVLVVRRDGISTNPANAAIRAQTNYKDGQLKPSPLNLFTATAGGFFAGDRVYVTKSEVKNDSVVLSLLATESFEGKRAQASVFFQFPKGALANTDFAKVAAVIAELFTLEPVVEELLPPACDQGHRAIFLDGKVTGVK